MSRLAFGPEPREMEVTDIATGHFVFSPVEGAVVSYQRLNDAITNAGYEIDRASIAVAGTLKENRHLETPQGQVFHLEAANDDLEARLGELEPGSRIAVSGEWNVEEGAEIVMVSTLTNDQ